MIKTLISQWWRLALIVLLTGFFASAIFVPHLNPVLRGWHFSDAEETTLVVSALREIAVAQSMLADAMPLENGSDALKDLGLDESRTNFAALTLHSPNQLSARLQRIGFLSEEILASELVLTMNIETRHWTCQVNGAWPERLLPQICRRTAVNNPEFFLRWIVAICLTIIALLAGILWFSNPLVRPIQRNPDALRKLPVGQLPRIDRVLSLLRRKKALLALAGVDQRDWIEAVSFSNQRAARKADLLALRLQARAKLADHWELRGSVFEWQFINDLPISLQQVLVYFPDPNLSGRELTQYLRSLNTGLDVMLVVPQGDTNVNAELLTFCRDSAQLFACLDQSVQTSILLDGSAQETLVRCLAEQLLVTRISPYQTRGGITRPSAFFGRQQILTRIINREPSNYLVVGGRQLGKTSLLKAVERHLRHQPDTECLYVSLRDNRLAPRLATLVGMKASDDLEQVLQHIAGRPNGRKLLLLVDEADPFMAHEACNGFLQLTTMRAHSDEGQIHFILAGFWELYAAASLNYQSPVRNFGEVITIGALEPEACRSLATEPLSLLGIHFDKASMADELVAETGGRANLIAIVCQECLEHLEPGGHVLGDDHLQPALNSQAVTDALSGWTRLSGNSRSCQIDRAIVYLIAIREHIDLQDLLGEFSQHWSGSEIQASLQRLRLAFIVRADGQQLRFAVPLFSRQLQPDEASAYLQSELAGTSDSV